MRAFRAGRWNARSSSASASADRQAPHLRALLAQREGVSPLAEASYSVKVPPYLALPKLRTDRDAAARAGRFRS